MPFFSRRRFLDPLDYANFVTALRLECPRSDTCSSISENKSLGCRTEEEVPAGLGDVSVYCRKSSACTISSSRSPIQTVYGVRVWYANIDISSSRLGDELRRRASE